MTIFIIIRRSHLRVNGAILLLIFSFHCFSLQPSSSHASAANSISKGQQLRDFEKLVSPKGIFELGFFSPGSSNSHYLGIWFKRQKYPPSPVWVANRNTPIPDSTGVLNIEDDGRLKIIYGGNGVRSIFFISKESSSTNSNTTATLLDSGNFVLTEPDFNGTGVRVLWQSFDYPTDTLLSGMKLGMNLKTGHNWSLTSWLSDQVPASGAFTLDMVDNNGTTQLVISRRWPAYFMSGISRPPAIYWRSGVWSGRQFENLIGLNSMWNEFSFPDRYDFSFVSNKDDKYFNYSSKVVSDPPILILVLSSLGELQVFEQSSSSSSRNHPLIQCETDRAQTPGCVDHDPSECRSGHEHFQLRRGVMVGGGLGHLNPTLGLIDCDTQCRSDCSCIAYANTNNNGTGCNFWSTGSKLKGNSDGSIIYILPSRQGKKWWIWFVIIIAIALIMSFSVFLSYLRWKKLKLKGDIEMEEEKLLLELGTLPSSKFSEASVLGRHGRKGHELILFNFDSIVAATDNFSSTNKLGEGGFGPVYKIPQEDNY